jgi:predicted Fe-Mo cluster-binding NifX family protein
MKIAAVTDDGFMISQHFGKAAYYWVVTIEDGVIVSEEKRDKLGHTHFSGEAHAEAHASEQHGFDPAAQHRHARMIEAIQDCDVLLARGMGAGAYESIRQAGIKPVVTDVETIDIAVQQYLAGILVDHVERLH